MSDVPSTDVPQILVDLMDRAKIPHAARTVQTEEAMRCPRTKVQRFQHHLAYNCPGHSVLSPKLPELRNRMRHPSFYCALLFLHTIFICFEEKDLKSQSMTSESISWVRQTMEQNTVVILVVGSLLMICLSCRSKVWYFCGSIAQGFLVPPSFIWSKEGVKSEYLGIISELKLLYWMTYQGGKHRKLWLALCMGAAPCHHLKDLISQRAWISAVLPAVIS